MSSGENSSKSSEWELEFMSMERPNMLRSSSSLSGPAIDSLPPPLFSGSFGNEGYYDLSMTELGSVDQSSRHDENTTTRSSFDSRQSIELIREEVVYSKNAAGVNYSQIPFKYQSNSPSLSTGLFTLTSVNSKSSRSFLETPIHIVPTHFRCSSRTIIQIDECMKSFLVGYSNLAYDCDKEHYKWSVALNQGSSRSKIEISIYEDYASESCYIIEANRLSGASDLFHSLFNDLKTSFGVSVASEASTSALPEMVVEPAETLSMEILTPIFNIANSANAEESSSFLCDLSFHQAVQDVLCSKEALAVLSEMLTSGTEMALKNVQSNVILALSNISDVPSFHSQIIASGLVPQLLQFVADGSYDTYEMRRNCACLIANLAASFSSDFAACFNSADHLRQWLNTLDNISDGQMKIHVHRVKNSLKSIAV